MDYISETKMDMRKVRSIRPWTDKEGNERFYIRDVGSLVSEYRHATGREFRSFYDDFEGRASAGRVNEIIEGNILNKTKAYIDSEGFLHIYGYAVYGEGARRMMPETITEAVNMRYGFCDERTREKNRELIGEIGSKSRIGDTVRIVRGRKEVGKVFEVANVTSYSFSRWADPSVYLYADDGFKVSGDNCEIVEVGYSF